MKTQQILKKEEIQKEAEEAHISYNCQSTICMSMSLGKSKVAINRIEKIFNINPDAKILFTGAREIFLENFKQELIKFEHEDWISKIDFHCVASLSKLDKLYDMIVADEVHKDADRIVLFLKEQLQNRNIEILCLTGTPKKRTYNSYSNEQSLYDIAPISYTKLMNEAIKEEFINNYRLHIVYHSLDNTNKTIKIKFKENTWYQTEQQRYDYLVSQYEKIRYTIKGFSFQLMMLKQFFKNLNSKKNLTDYFLATSLADKKTLIYAGSIEQSELFNLPTYHSKLPKNIKQQNFLDFLKGNIKHLVDVNGIKESVNIPDLTHALVMSPDASEHALLQSIGRVLRLSVENTADFIVLCAKNTIEEKWLNKAIKTIPTNLITETFYNSKTNIFQIIKKETNDLFTN